MEKSSFYLAEEPVAEAALRLWFACRRLLKDKKKLALLDIPAKAPTSHTGEIKKIYPKFPDALLMPQRKVLEILMPNRSVKERKSIWQSFLADGDGATRSQFDKLVRLLRIDGQRIG
jgi:hypothetical protein